MSNLSESNSRQDRAMFSPTASSSHRCDQAGPTSLLGSQVRVHCSFCGRNTTFLFVLVLLVLAGTVDSQQVTPLHLRRGSDKPIVRRTSLLKTLDEYGLAAITTIHRFLGGEDELVPDALPGWETRMGTGQVFLWSVTTLFFFSVMMWFIYDRVYWAWAGFFSCCSLALYQRRLEHNRRQVVRRASDFNFGRERRNNLEQLRVLVAHDRFDRAMELCCYITGLGDRALYYLAKRSKPSLFWSTVCFRSGYDIYLEKQYVVKDALQRIEDYVADFHVRESLAKRKSPLRQFEDFLHFCETQNNPAHPLHQHIVVFAVSAIPQLSLLPTMSSQELYIHLVRLSNAYCARHDLDHPAPWLFERFWMQFCAEEHFAGPNPFHQVSSS